MKQQLEGNVSLKRIMSSTMSASIDIELLNSDGLIRKKYPEALVSDRCLMAHLHLTLHFK